MPTALARVAALALSVLAFAQAAWAQSPTPVTTTAPAPASATAPATAPECIAPAKPGGGFDLTCRLARAAFAQAGPGG
ncbi:MAG TPA: hypothetical protein VK195_14505, partial [Burkholderiaceae bacterium]|nr:hypothetical protein [Burkholderiaceae bacterium]